MNFRYGMCKEICESKKTLSKLIDWWFTGHKKEVAQIIGAGADSASVNKRHRDGLFKNWQGYLKLLAKVHCFSYQLELAGGDSL